VDALTLERGTFIYAMLVVAGSVLAVSLLTLVGTAGPAEAVFPGTNGRIGFGGNMTSGPGVDNPQGDTEIFTMNPDGTGLEQLTHNSAYDYDPAWSANAKRITFSSNRATTLQEPNNTEVYVMRADGTGQRRLTDTPGDNWNPTWSPSGGRIAFQSNRNVSAENTINTEIYSVKADGTGQRRLTKNTASDLMPDWSPDGKKIAFYSTRRNQESDIFVMNANDGSSSRRVVSTAGYDYDPDWSPAGTRIVFGNEFRDIYTVRPNGTGLKNLTNTSDSDERSSEPSWSPNGKKITFGAQRVVGFDDEIGAPIFEVGIYLINPDGSSEKRIQGTDDFDGVGIDWQALP
jgi:Tol biopolymer transport system component